MEEENGEGLEKEKEMRKYIYYIGLLLCGLTATALRAQTNDATEPTKLHHHIGGLETSDVLYGDLYGRFLSLEGKETAPSEQWHLLWMSSLASDSEPSLLLQRATFRINMGDQEGALRDLATAYEASGKDYKVGRLILFTTIHLEGWELAEEITDQLLTDKPDDAQLLGVLFQIYDQKGDSERALGILQRLQERSTGMMKLGISSKMLELLRKSQHYAEATDLAQRMLEEYDWLPYLVIQAADIYTEQERAIEAVELLKQGLEKNPTDLLLRSAYLTYMMRMEKYDEYHTLVLQYATEEGADPSTIIQLIRETLPYAKEKETALRRMTPLLQKLHEIYPNHDSITIMLAVQKGNEGDRAEQERMLQELITKGTEDVAPYAYFIEQYANNDDTLALRGVVDKALQHLPTLGMAHLYNILLPAMTEDYVAMNAAMELALSKVDQSDPYYPGIALLKADQLMEHDDLEEARPYYEAAIKGGLPTALNNYAYGLATHGTPEDLPYAERLAREAVRTSEDEPSHLDTYAWILYLRGSYAMAKLYMEKAIARSAEIGEEPNPTYQEHLAAIEEALGNYDKAKEAWLKVIESEGDEEEAQKELKRIEDLIKKESKDE